LVFYPTASIIFAELARPAAVVTCVKQSGGNKNINYRNLCTLIRRSGFAVIASIAIIGSMTAQALEVETPDLGLTGVPMEIVLSGAAGGAAAAVTVGGKSYSGIADAQGRAVIPDVVIDASGTVQVTAMVGGETAVAPVRVIPGFVSVLPAFLAIAAALLIRNVVPALLLGLWLGATALQTFSPFGVLKGLLDTFAVFIAAALADADHAAIILFTMMIGGMVGIITRNGGMASVVLLIASRAKTAVGGQVSVWLMGLMIFFDDYANTLVVGNTARPITDHLKISREKLAYIVDSTAAPVVCLALVTTWIGYEVSLIDDALQGIDELADVAAYTIFLQSIPYSFYPILAVVFVLAVATTGKDLGPMYHAELRARLGEVAPPAGDAMPSLDGETLEPKANIPLRVANAFVPIITLILGLGVSLYATGEGDTITDIVGSADPYKALMWASFVGALTAAGMSVGQRILSSNETVDAWYGGARATLFGMIVLILAWAMAAVTGDLNAKGYLISILGDSLPVVLVPAIVFLLAAVTAFATGTSWGTMGILMPLVIPLAWAVMSINGLADMSGMHILYSSVACTLAGAVWGDHCSPISDTTVLSSIASGCDHIEHVRTQMPYALIVGVVAILIGTVPAGYGVPPWMSLIVGALVLIGVLRFFGRSADEAAG
jgi:Na+/H+ antiporter NhaC